MRQPAEAGITTGKWGFSVLSTAHTVPDCNSTHEYAATVWLTTQGCAKRGQCCDATIRRAIKAGELGARTIGGRYRVHVARFDAWLEEQSTPRVLTDAERTALSERNRRAVRARWDRRTS